MNAKKIYHNIQERIALDNFKIETRKRRNKKKILITLSAIAIIFAGLITINSMKENNEI